MVERVCKPIYETANRQVTEIVCVPTQVEKRFSVTYCREVLEPKTVQCTVMVPVIQQREVRVPVCTRSPSR